MSPKRQIWNYVSRKELAGNGNKMTIAQKVLEKAKLLRRVPSLASSQFPYKRTQSNSTPELTQAPVWKKDLKIRGQMVERVHRLTFSSLIFLI